jgi:AcrR family transcriptional regulator
MPVDRIVATALRIVDRKGADALSMRTLAQHLKSGTATLYRHFTSRADLIAHVIDRVLGEIALDDDELASMTWQEATRAVAHAMFKALSRHKNVSPLLLGQVPVGPNAMANRERSLATLLRAGFPPALAARVYTTVSRYVLGFAIQLDPSNRAGRPSAEVSAAFRDLDRSRFPAIIQVAGSLPVSLDEEFAFGLELLLEGLGHRRR